MQYELNVMLSFLKHKVWALEQHASHNHIFVALHASVS